MNPTHADILKQLATGDISADEAAARMRGSPRPNSPQAEAALARRWLRVRVSDLHTGRQKVNINLPLSWVAMGLRIGAKYSPEVGRLDLDDILDELKAGGTGRIIDVEDLEDGQHVEIFVE